MQEEQKENHLSKKNVHKTHYKITITMKNALKLSF